MADKKPNETAGKAGKAKSKSRKKTSKARKIISILVLVAVFAAYFAGLVFFENEIDERLGFREAEPYTPAAAAGNTVTEGALNVHFIDVGQGDACLIELPDDRTMLIDAGENKKTVQNSLRDYMDKVNEIRTANERPEITYFDYAIASHSDSDHIGSMAYILGLYPAKVFYRPNEQATYTGYADPALTATADSGKFWKDTTNNKWGEKSTVTYKNAIEAGYKTNADFTPQGIVTNPFDDSQNKIVPDAAQIPENHDLYYEINFYGPQNSFYSNHNNYSPIIIIEYKGRRIALSGDCEAAGEASFAAKAQEGQGRYSVFDDTFAVDIIKLGHHGSGTSSSAAYLNVLTAGIDKASVYTVISVGEGNSYKHPHAEVLARLNTMGFDSEKILRTDKRGSIFMALVYSGSGVAAIALEGDILPDAVYPNRVAGIEIRYRTLGILILIICCAIFIPLALIPGKKGVEAAAAGGIAATAAAIATVAATKNGTAPQSGVITVSKGSTVRKSQAKKTTKKTAKKEPTLKDTVKTVEKINSMFKKRK